MSIAKEKKMYYCAECGSKFDKTKIIYEKHNLSNPPYEKIICCPLCGSNQVEEKNVSHCRCCGIKLKNQDNEYCSRECEQKGKKLWRLQNKKLRTQKSHPINIILRELEEYNKRNNLSLSYGQYIAYVKFAKRK